MAIPILFPSKIGQCNNRTMQRVQSYIGIGASILTIWYACAFHIIDFDFWWHVAAGRVLRAEGWIHTDPFAYTRIGLPYFATQSWLAQILLSLIYDFTGVTGTIIFRTGLMIGVVVPIFLLKPKQMWAFAPLATYAVLAMRPAILDRPQLFSFVIFSFCFWMAQQWLDSRISTKKYCIIAFLLQVLWVNMHGGAALLHLGIIGSVFLQKRDKDSLMVGVLLTAALFVSPNFLHTFSYVQNLFSDQTVGFIQEWEPRQLANYLRWILPCWILGLGSTFYFRRHLSFSIITLLLFGYLSTQAIRHEPFFILVATLLTVYQTSLPSVLEEKQWKKILILLIGSGLMVVLGANDKYLAVGRLGRDRYGAYEPAKGAYDFVEREGIEGEMFNTYEAGGYLLFRGYPDRKVFVDGRNVDYGFEYLVSFFAAGTDAEQFRMLEDRYTFSYAIVQFEYFAGMIPLPFVTLFDQFPDWALVYIDNSSAVYVRQTDHADLVAEYEYTQLKPLLVLEPTRALPRISGIAYEELESEIVRALEVSPNAVQLSLLRAVLYSAVGLYTEAEEMLVSVKKRAPYSYQYYNILAMIRLKQERFAEAGALFEKAITVGGGASGASMNPQDLAWLFEQAGDVRKAEYYRRKGDKKITNY